MDFPQKTRDQSGSFPPNAQPIQPLAPTLGKQGLIAFSSQPEEAQSGQQLAGDSSPGQPPPDASGPGARSGVALWTQRIFLVIFVVFCIELGMLLTVLPWQRIWTENGLLIGSPNLRIFLGNNFVRGVASGIGLVDIWIGIWEAIHYRETPETRF